MLKNYVSIIKDVFSHYPEFTLGEIKEDESSLWVNFLYQKIILVMHISNPDTVHLRSISVYTGKVDIKDLQLLPHHLRFDDAKNIGILCLLDQEQFVLSSYSFEELLELYVGQTDSLLHLSRKEIEIEYLKEFQYYWSVACQSIGGIYRDAEVYLPTSEKASILNCWYFENKKRGRYVIFPDDIEFNAPNMPKGSVTRGVYVPIEYPVGIIPPQKDIPWNAADLLSILYNPTKDRISEDTFDFLKKLEIDNFQKIIVFSIQISELVTIAITGILKFANNNKKSFIKKIQEDFLSFTPIKSNRMDLKYLHERVGQENTVPPAVLVLGCGSVGSYLIPELINMGIVHLGISDPDIFESGNAFRHYLGPKRHGQNKAEAMKTEIESYNPLVHVQVLQDLTNLDDRELSKVLEKYQVIIIAVGSTDLQRELNYRFSKLNSTSWFLYNWLDAEGKGAHVLAMRYAQKGCYNCLFYNHGKETTKCKISFTDGTEKIINNGCGGSFSPYGNNVLIRNTALTISILQEIQKENLKQNTVVSIKNDFSTLAGSISMSPIINSNFADEGCEICGHI